MTPKHAGVSVGTVTRLPIAMVKPDPLQPRKNADSDLSASILQNGQQVPITVWSNGDGTFTILNGERRYRGCLAAKYEDIDAMIVPEPSKAERMLKQVVANQGKPLTPVEEAFAFKQIMADNKWSQNELSKRLGIPRSTVGDRIRMIELHPAWLDLIKEGKLQASHSPVLHQYRVVPEEYHEKAAKHYCEASWRAKVAWENKSLVPVDDQFKDDVHSAYKDWIKELSRLGKYAKEYDGVKVTRKERHYVQVKGKYDYVNEDVEYAAEPKKWRPLWNKAEKDRKASMPSYGNGNSKNSKGAAQKDFEKFCKANGLVSTASMDKKSEDEFVVWNVRYGTPEWRSDIVPADFMAKLDLSKLRAIFIKPKSNYDNPTIALASTDLDALRFGQAAYNALLKGVEDEYVAQAKLTLAKLPEYTLMGEGCAKFIQYGDFDRGDAWSDVTPRRVLARAVDVDIDKLVRREMQLQPWFCANCENNEGDEQEIDDEDGVTLTICKPDESRPLLCVSCAHDSNDIEYAELAKDPPQRREEEVEVVDTSDMEAVERLASAWLAYKSKAVVAPQKRHLIDALNLDSPTLSSLTVTSREIEDTGDEEEDEEDVEEDVEQLDLDEEAA